MSKTCRSLTIRASLLGACLLLSISVVTPILAADGSTTRSLPFSKQQVEKALQRLGASGGRLPTLYGFVQTETNPLDKYQQGFYQYKILVTATAPTSASVEISAEITAWHTDDSPGMAGYQLLVSNGRLESDLLDRLESALKAGDSPRVSTGAASKDPRPESLPDAPSVTRTAHLNQPQVASPPSIAGVPPSGADESDEMKIRQLTKELTVLKEIRDNQTTPNDLAVVVAPKTPVLSRPVKGAETILFADADDELQVIGMDAEWVHVHLLGPSRGWVRRSQLDLSSVSASSLSAQPATHPNVQPFRKTREEVNTFPGSWKPLVGQKVSIVWVEPTDDSAHISDTTGMSYLQSVLREESAALSRSTNSVAGVVVVLDSADGGMIAATTSSLQRWHAGGLSDKSFLKECWFDPPDLFRGPGLTNNH